MPYHGRHCIQTALESFLDQRVKRNPSLDGWLQPILFLERPEVQAVSKEEMDHVVDQLPIRVWVAAQERNLSTIFDTLKEHSGASATKYWPRKVALLIFKMAGVG